MSISPPQEPRGAFPRGAFALTQQQDYSPSFGRAIIQE